MDMNQLFSLKGRTALITGGSRGLGAATAEAFAGHGADVAISYAASADKAEAVRRAATDALVKIVTGTGSDAG